jgi:uncharacterized protein (DUF433 family)
MQLEDYFDFEKFDTKFGPVERIRIKGHRIAIDRVIELFNQGMPPDQIQREAFPSLTTEDVYATITYYLHNKIHVDDYMQKGEVIADAYYQEYLQQEPSAAAKRIRAIKDQLQRPDDAATS